MLLFRDGLDTASILGEDRVMQVARRSDAIVYAIVTRDVPRGIGGRVPVDTAATDDRFLDRLARETGRLLHAERNRDIERVFTRVLEEFDSRYALGHAPRNVPAGGWHRVDVRVRKRGATVLARRGYFAN